MDNFAENAKENLVKMGESILKESLNDQIDVGPYAGPITDRDDEDDVVECQDVEGCMDDYKDREDSTDDRIGRLYKNVYSIKYDDGYRLFDAGSMCDLIDEDFIYIKRISGTPIVMLGCYGGVNDDSIFSLKETTAPCKLYNLETRKFLFEDRVDDAIPLSGSIMAVAAADKYRMLNSSTGQFIGGEDRVFQKIQHLNGNLYLVSTDAESYHIYDIESDKLTKVNNKDMIIQAMLSSKAVELSGSKPQEQNQKKPSITCGNMVKTQQYQYNGNNLNVKSTTEVSIDDRCEGKRSVLVTKHISDDVSFIYNTNAKLGRLIRTSTMEPIVDDDIFDIRLMRGDLARLSLSDGTFKFLDLQSMKEVEIEGFDEIHSIIELDRMLYVIENDDDDKFIVRFSRTDAGVEPQGVVELA